jgi:hypothetical protein
MKGLMKATSLRPSTQIRFDKDITNRNKAKHYILTPQQLASIRFRPSYKVVVSDVSTHVLASIGVCITVKRLISDRFMVDECSADSRVRCLSIKLK